MVMPATIAKQFAPGQTAFALARGRGLPEERLVVQRTDLADCPRSRALPPKGLFMVDHVATSPPAANQIDRAPKDGNRSDRS
jgi:hypothetical protein